MTSSKAPPKLVSGVPAITDWLARNNLILSESTVRRLYREDKLPGAFKVAGRTSPIRMPMIEIEKLAKGGRSR